MPPRKKYNTSSLFTAASDREAAVGLYRRCNREGVLTCLSVSPPSAFRLHPLSFILSPWSLPVLLGEPPRTAYDLNFPLLGIPVRVSPWFWLVTVIMGSKRQDAGAIITWIAAVFLSILIHELGHALVMRKQGFRPWIVLYAMGGLACYDPRDALRSGKSGWLEQVFVSAAGPVAGFLLAAILVLGVVAAGHGHPIDIHDFWEVMNPVALPNARLAALLNDIFYICVLWGLVNLLPVYPLDGGQIARELFLNFSPGDGIRQSMLLSTFAAGAMAVYGLVQWKSAFVALFFGYLAYSSFTALQAYSSRRPW
jgi:stage IV sporulation protein FB